jgi:hypothetical protein
MDGATASRRHESSSFAPGEPGRDTRDRDHSSPRLTPCGANAATEGTLLRQRTAVTWLGGVRVVALGEGPRPVPLDVPVRGAVLDRFKEARAMTLRA